MSSRATVSCDVQALRSCQGDDPAGGGRGGGAGPQSVRLLAGGQSCSVEIVSACVLGLTL